MFPQQKRRKTLLDFNFKKIRNNDCENVKKSTVFPLMIWHVAKIIRRM